MKAFQPLKAVFVFLLIVAGSTATHAQSCPNGGSPQQVTYDTTTIGTGSDGYNFSLRKFDPSIGTLLGVRITYSERLNYTFALQNNDSVDRSFLTRMIRTTDVTSSALTEGGFSRISRDSEFNMFIPSKTERVRGPVYMAYSGSYSVAPEEMTNFLGTGDIDYQYDNGAALTITGSLLWALKFSEVADTTRFGITYTYCANSVLPLPLTAFRAARASANTVNVAFTVPDLSVGANYYFEQSLDGRTFSEVVSLGSISEYHNSVVYEKAPDERFVMRIKQVKATGAISYSQVREIAAADVRLAGNASLYPNPAKDRFSVNIPHEGNGSYKVSVIGLDGQQSLQHHFSTGGMKSISIPSRLARGIYFVETRNMLNGKRYVTKLSIQ